MPIQPYLPCDHRLGKRPGDPFLFPDQQWGFDQSTLPFNPYKPSRALVTDMDMIPGQIVLPCHIDHRKAAATTCISPHDITGLINRNYHGRELGFYTLKCKINFLQTTTPPMTMDTSLPISASWA